MSLTAKMKKKRNKKAARSEIDNESQTAVAVTVFWMLSAFATLAAELMWGVTSLLKMSYDAKMITGLSRLSLFIGAVTALCALCSTPVVMKVRATKPPVPVTWGVVAIGAVAVGLALFA